MCKLIKCSDLFLTFDHSSFQKLSLDLLAVSQLCKVKVTFGKWLATAASSSVTSFRKCMYMVKNVAINTRSISI